MNTDLSLVIPFDTRVFSGLVDAEPADSRAAASVACQHDVFDDAFHALGRKTTRVTSGRPA